MRCHVPTAAGLLTCPPLPSPAPLQEELQTQLAGKVSDFEDLAGRFAKLEEETGATQVGAGASTGRRVAGWV